MVKTKTVMNYVCSKCNKIYPDIWSAKACEKRDKDKETMENIENLTQFTITENHIKLLKRMYVDWDDCEYGAPCINPKRPYGNSDVQTDIKEITGLKGMKAEIIHKEMQIVLQIICTIGKIETGLYTRNNEYDIHSWEKVN